MRILKIFIIFTISLLISIKHIATLMDKSTGATRGYKSNSELEDSLKDFSNRCSNISKLYSIGNSVNDVPLWVVKISDKPGSEEAKPAFKFVGNVHGNEPVGRELLLLLANWLCDNYIKDQLATFIIENVHLHLLPSLNPDGFSARKRENANNIDLNRDFPDQFFRMNDDVNYRQPETRAIMNWAKDIHFTASASIHGGALVVNYPWDGTKDKRKSYFACPDDESFQYIASIYSHYHKNMSMSKEFKGGITNGAFWYPIYGGMQDWNYIEGGCFELTLEISDKKWPDADELPFLWENNKMSMLNLVASTVKSAIHGKIFSSDCGKPLPASVGISGINYSIKAGKTFSDYHRLLAPGKRYEVTASMPGYKSKTAKVVMENEAVSVDFILDPDMSLGGNARGNCCECRNGKFNLPGNIYTGLPLLFLPIIALLYILLRKSSIFSRGSGRAATISRRSSSV